jgi:hypothetical protein
MIGFCETWPQIKCFLSSSVYNSQVLLWISTNQCFNQLLLWFILDYRSIQCPTHQCLVHLEQLLSIVPQASHQDLLRIAEYLAWLCWAVGWPQFLWAHVRQCQLRRPGRWGPRTPACVLYIHWRHPILLGCGRSYATPLGTSSSLYRRETYRICRNGSSIGRPPLVD